MSLSKSNFVRYKQCEKSLYLYKKHYALRDKPDAERQVLFDKGTDLGIRARNLFPGGLDLSPKRFDQGEKNYQQTLFAISEGHQVLYEASFFFKGIAVIADLVVFEKGEWNIYEVKSSLKISQNHIQDAAIQQYVIENCLENFGGFYLVNLNADYQRGEDLDFHQLFKFSEVTEKARALFPEIENDLVHIAQLLESTEVPDKNIGVHCDSPYPCDFKGYCWAGIKNADIQKIGGLNHQERFEFMQNDLNSFSDLKEVKELPNRIRIQVESYLQNRKCVDIQKLKKLTDQLSGSLSYFDMESCNPPIPQFPGDKPYGVYPFLFVVDSGNEKPAFNFYFSEPHNDHRKELAESLIENTRSLEKLVVFDPGYENIILTHLQNKFPHWKHDLELVKSKFFDVSLAIKHALFYHPLMNGGFSLKSLYPIYLTAQEENRLHIKTGLLASFEYEKMLNARTLVNNTPENTIVNYCVADVLVTRRFTEDLLNLSHTL